MKKKPTNKAAAVQTEVQTITYDNVPERCIDKRAIPFLGKPTAHKSTPGPTETRSIPLLSNVANAGEVPDGALTQEIRRPFAEWEKLERAENERILGSFLQRACHESSGDAQSRERRTREIRNTFGFGIDFPPKNINPECDPDDVNAYYDMTCEFFRQFCNGELTRMWEAGEKVAPIERIQLMLTHAVAFGFQHGCKFEAETGAANQS